MGAEILGGTFIATPSADVATPLGVMTHGLGTGAVAQEVGCASLNHASSPVFLPALRASACCPFTRTEVLRGITAVDEL